MTNNLLNEITLDNSSGMYILSAQTDPSQYIFANPSHFDQFDKLYSDRQTTQNMIGVDFYLTGNGLKLAFGIILVIEINN